jgi:zinc transport system substrate-binding protein
VTFFSPLAATELQLAAPASAPPAVRRPRGRLGALALVAMVLAGCQGVPAAGREAHIVVSLYPLYDLTRQIAGDRARVTLLVPPGVEPHDWEPAPADLVRVQSARLLVYNGAGVEPWVDRLVPELRSTRVLNATGGLELLTKEGQADPHVWLDPILARSQVEAIRAAVVAVDPQHAPAYDANAAALSGRLLGLHERFTAGLTHCDRREIVVSHAAFAYLARRYHLTQLPIIASLAPDAEPTPAALAALTRHARRMGVTHVFFETLVSAKVADTLAREVGAKTLVLDPIEGLTREPHEHGVGYIELMDANLANLRTGLGCR